MTKRESYSDDFTGAEDRRIRGLLYGNNGENINSKLRRIIMNVIDNELTAKQRECVMLYYFGGSTMEEIARRKNCTKQAVSATISRARLKITDILKYYM